MNKSNKFSPKVRERAVRMVLEHRGEYLRQLGLGVVLLTPDEMSLAQQVKNDQPGLSLPDCFALSCASRPDHVLVTGDGLLCK